MHLHTLPHDVASMKLTAPTLWAQAFSDEDPVASKFPAGILQKAISCIPMRISRSDSMQIAPAMRSSSSQAAVHDIGAAGLGNVLQQFAVGLSSQLASMQQCQQQMLMAMQGQAPRPDAASSQLMVEDGPSPAESRFMRRAQSRLTLLDAPALPPIHPPASEATRADAPVEPSVAKERPDANASKSVDQVAESMLKALSQKTDAKGRAGTTAEPPAKKPVNMAKAKGSSKASNSKPKASSKASNSKPKVSSKASSSKPKAGSKDSSSKPTKKDVQSKPPSISVERSRSQVLCRTGFMGPGQNHALSFHSHGGEKNAVKEANKWLAAERKKRGL